MEQTRVGEIGDDGLGTEAIEDGDAAAAADLPDHGITAGTESGDEGAAQWARCASDEGSHSAASLGDSTEPVRGRRHCAVSEDTLSVSKLSGSLPDPRLPPAMVDLATNSYS
ncbi:MAG: hypothetical protein NVS1B4_02630 [Gemmatimonadaceae bacterium]